MPVPELNVYGHNEEEYEQVHDDDSYKAKTTPGCGESRNVIETVSTKLLVSKQYYGFLLWR